MNEKIQELAKKAAEKTCSLDFERTWDERTWHRVYNEQFAELIIEDCLDTISYGGEYVNRVKLVEQLKSHFGVE